MYVRSFNYFDIVEAKDRFNNLTEYFTKQLSEHYDHNEKKQAFFWLEVIYGLQRAQKIDFYIQRYRTEFIDSIDKPLARAGKKPSIGSVQLIPNEFIHHIFYVYYGLDPKIAKDALPLANRYNAEEAAKKLGTSKHNLIKKCLDSSLGVYINSSKFKIHRAKGSQCNKELIGASADITYPYRYQGLVRLSTSALKILYTEKITTNGQELRFIECQPSLSEVIQGISLLIELRGKQKITIDDLLFIEDEILAYLKKPQLVSTELPSTLENSSNDVFPVKITQTIHQDNVSQKKINNSEKTIPSSDSKEVKALIFNKKGEYFEIKFVENEYLIQTTHGLIYIDHLINNPNKIHSIFDLRELTHKAEISDLKENAKQELNEMSDDFFLNMDDSFQQDVLSPKTIEEYNVRLQDINKQLETICGDSNKRDQLQKEKEWIEADLKNNYYKNSSRSFNNQGEKVRKAVSKAIHNALRNIENQSKDLHDFLQDRIKPESNFWQFKNNL